MGGPPIDPLPVECLACGEIIKVRVKEFRELTAICSACGARMVKEAIKFNDKGSLHYCSMWKIQYYFDFVENIGFDDDDVTDEDYDEVCSIGEFCEMIQKFGGCTDRAEEASMKDGTIAKIAHTVDWERIKSMSLEQISEYERIERTAADRFVGEMFDIGYDLYLTRKCLSVHADTILNDERVFPKENHELFSCNQAAMEAYIGQTLINVYGGSWIGVFSDKSPGGNFYTSKLKIGEYEYKPSHYLGYRLSNGEESEGSFRSHIECVFKEIESAIIPSEEKH